MRWDISLTKRSGLKRILIMAVMVLETGFLSLMETMSAEILPVAESVSLHGRMEAFRGQFLQTGGCEGTLLPLTRFPGATSTLRLTRRDPLLFLNSDIQ